MSDNKTAYRGENYHLPQEGEATQYQQQYGADPYAQDPQAGQVNQNWQYGAQGQGAQGAPLGQGSQQFAAQDTAQQQGVDYSGIYGETASQNYQQPQDQQTYYSPDQVAQGYGQGQYQDLGGVDTSQYAQQGYDPQQTAYQQGVGYGEEEVNPYLAAHQNATPPYDASQTGYQTQDQAVDYQQDQNANYYGQAHMDAGQTQFVDYAQVPSDQVPASYNPAQPGYGHAGVADGYAQDAQYADYNAYGGAQNLQPVPQGMPHVNDPYAAQQQYQHVAVPVEDDFQASGRKSFLVGTMILGSVIVGGGVAFAYKYSGDSSNQPPMIVSDAGKVKVEAENPGGRELANQNKKIFARLGDATRQGAEEIITTTDGDAMDGLRGQVKDPSNNVGAVKKQQAADAPGGVRKVKTYRINRNGERIADTSVGALKQGSDVKDITGVAVDTGKPARTVKIMRADAPVKKNPVTRQEVASIKRKVAAPAADGSYVVQISARRTEQDALAAFSGMKAKYGDALDGYRPLIQRADLGAKGVWYRLRVGPMASKDTAGSVCSQLKSKGLKSCFVTTR